MWLGILGIWKLIIGNWPAFLAIAVVSAGGGFYAGWSWHGALNEAEKLKAVNEALVARDAAREIEQTGADNAGKKLQNKLTAAEKKNRELTRRLNNEVFTSSVYGDCVFTPAGVRTLNDTIDSFESVAPGQ